MKSQEHRYQIFLDRIDFYLLGIKRFSITYL